MALKITISKIHVNSISYLGSLNIGKTILCRNESTAEFQPAPTIPPGKELDIKLAPAQPIPEPLSPAFFHEPPPGFTHPEVTPPAPPHPPGPPIIK